MHEQGVAKRTAGCASCRADSGLGGIEAAGERGLVQVNVVVMRGQNEDEIADFVELTRHQPVNVRFIEYMPFDGNVWSNEKLVSYRAMQQAVQDAFPQVPRVPVPGASACLSQFLRVWPLVTL